VIYWNYQFLACTVRIHNVSLSALHTVSYPIWNNTVRDHLASYLISIQGTPTERAELAVFTDSITDLAMTTFTDIPTNSIFQEKQIFTLNAVIICIVASTEISDICGVLSNTNTLKYSETIYTFQAWFMDSMTFLAILDFYAFIVYMNSIFLLKYCILMIKCQFNFIIEVDIIPWIALFADFISLYLTMEYLYTESFI